LQNLQLCRKRGCQIRIFQELRNGVQRFQEVLQLPQKAKDERAAERRNHNSSLHTYLYSWNMLKLHVPRRSSVTNALLVNTLEEQSKNTRLRLRRPFY